MRWLSIRKAVILTFICGGLWVLSMQFIFLDQQAVHYHANFALYLNGRIDNLDQFNFYEETTVCSLSDKQTPPARVHLHNQSPHLVHVHDDGATWGHLMANLGYSVNNNTLQIAGVNHQTGDRGWLRFILNGQPVYQIANRVIGDQDVLLIDYSNDEQDTLEARYQSIPRNAYYANSENDPKTCAGQSAESVWRRIKRIITGQ